MYLEKGDIMIPKVHSVTCVGIQAYPITIEVDDSLGLPKIIIIGLPDQAIKESKDRIRSAITASGFYLPSKSYTINLAPADIKKEGPGFDLPIAIGLLTRLQYVPPLCLEPYSFIGELALDGALRSIHSTLSMALGLKGSGKMLIVPEGNYHEATLQKDVPIIPARDLAEVVKIITEPKTISRQVNEAPQRVPQQRYAIDLEDIKGQACAKRALEIAVAGAHNILMIGPPGSGKTLLARSIPSLLPKATHDEFLDIVRIYSARAQIKRLSFERPFRAPHHTISAPAMAGSGTSPKPGEISLAHNGVLFLDEFPEFPRSVLETLRGPLEDKQVTIARSKDTFTYPANFMLACAMNPCPCGYLGDTERECTCSYDRIVKYRSRISGPILDRIDIHIEVPRIKHQELKIKRGIENSAVARERIERVRARQFERYKENGFYTNAGIPPKLIQKYCALSDDADAVLDMAVKELHLSARSYHRTLKLARTIADVEDSVEIKVEHVSEAVQYRSLDRQI